MDAEPEPPLLDREEERGDLGAERGGDALLEVSGARRQHPHRPALVLEPEGDLGVRQRQAEHRVLHVLELGLGAPEELAPGGHGAEEVLDADLGPGPGRCRARPGSRPPSTRTSVPSGAPWRAVRSTSRDTEAMAASASPRNPRVPMARRSSGRPELAGGVAADASSASSGDMPDPSSVTSMSRVPPPSMATRIERAPASSAFSPSSLTTEAGRSTTSPAAIWSMSASLRTAMVGMAPGSGGPFALHRPRGMGQERGSSLRVAVTGPTSEFGALLLPRLLAEPRVEQLLTFGPRPVTGARLVHHRVDLTRWDVESELESALSAGPVDVLYHLAFLHGRTRGAAFAHELEVIGTLHTLAAAVRAGVRHVVDSVDHRGLRRAGRGIRCCSTRTRTLHGCPGSRFVNDRVEVERQLVAFRRDHPGVGLTVFRFAPVLGPTVDNPPRATSAGRWCRRSLGFDPLWQAVHEEDARELLLRVLEAPVSGTFNVVSDDVLPLSALIRLAGTHAAPLAADPRPGRRSGPSTRPESLRRLARSSTTFTTPGWRMGPGRGPCSDSGRGSGRARPPPR